MQGMTRPNPPGGYTGGSNDFSYLRKFEGHIVQPNCYDTTVQDVDESQHSVSFDDIFGNTDLDNDND